MKLMQSLTLLAAVLGAPLHAHEGHADAALDAPVDARARLSAVSETFELVGVLDGKRLVLWLDRFADNAPVRDARIELDVAGTKRVAAVADDGAYAVMLDAEPKPGLIPVAATVSTGADSDLLAGELDVHEAVPTVAAADAGRWRSAAIGAAAAIVVSALALFARRRRGVAR